MPGWRRQVQPLTPREMEAFDRVIAPTDPFQAWLGEAIFTQPSVPVMHRAAGVAGFIMGGVSTLVTYYLAKDLMKIFGANNQVGSGVATIVIMGRIPLNGNGLQDCLVRALHDYYQQHPLPRKNNRSYLRKFTDAVVYVSSAALGLMGVYILWTNLPYGAGLRGFLLPSILIGNGVVNVLPFLDANNNIFAKYSPGLTIDVRDKRAALIEALNVSLNDIRAYDAATFGAFYEAMTARPENETDIQARWEALLKMAEDPKQPAPLPKTAFIKYRGYFGWLLSLLSSLTNIQISYAEAKWLGQACNIKNESFVPAFGIISSVLCVVAYGVLCAGPTQTAFENQTVKKGWEPTHPWLRKGSMLLATIFGFASAIPNASWPIVLGTTYYEKSLAGPAFISPGSLYFSAILIMLNRLIDTFDRWMGESNVIDHMDFLAKLEMLPTAIAQLPDELIDKMLTSEHPLLVKYRASHLPNPTEVMVQSSPPLENNMRQ